MTKLIADRITKQYQNKIAVDTLSLSLGPGLYGLLGANGAGKTTLLRMLAGVLQPDRGEIFLGKDPVQSERYRAHMGYLPQEFGCYPGFTARDFLLYLALLKGLSKNSAQEKIRKLLDTVGLSEAADKKVKTFSGGMKRRLGIAQALLNDPYLLILDEPTAGLDPKERVRFRNLISQLKAGRILILSTHIVSDVEYIADKIFLMQKGQIPREGSVKEILQSMDSSVWECRTDPAQAELLKARYPIVNIREEAGQVFLRLCAREQPCRDAVRVKPTLEDVYLYDS